MFCSNCGAQLSQDASFCPSCGRPATAEPASAAKKEAASAASQHEKPVQVAATTVPKKTVTGQVSLWNWSMGKEELQLQVEQYDSLGWSKSYRKISVVLLMFSVVITTLLIIFADFSSAGFIDVAVFLLLAFFVYRGGRVPVVLAMIWWTLEKGYQLIQIGSNPNSGSAIVPIFWWLIYMGFFWKAYKVERERAARKTQTQ